MKPRKYQWEQWFEQPQTVLVRGVDYHCSQTTMSGMIRNNASRRGVRTRLIDNGDSIIIEVVNLAIPHSDRTTVAG